MKKIDLKLKTEIPEKDRTLFNLVGITESEDVINSKVDALVDKAILQIVSDGGIIQEEKGIRVNAHVSKILQLIIDNVSIELSVIIICNMLRDLIYSRIENILVKNNSRIDVEDPNSTADTIKEEIENRGFEDPTILDLYKKILFKSNDNSNK